MFATQLHDFAFGTDLHSSFKCLSPALVVCYGTFQRKNPLNTGYMPFKSATAAPATQSRAFFLIPLSSPKLKIKNCHSTSDSLCYNDDSLTNFSIHSRFSHTSLSAIILVSTLTVMLPANLSLLIPLTFVRNISETENFQVHECEVKHTLPLEVSPFQLSLKLSSPSQTIFRVVSNSLSKPLENSTLLYNRNLFFYLKVNIYSTISNPSPLYFHHHHQLCFGAHFPQTLRKIQF